MSNLQLKITCKSMLELHKRAFKARLKGHQEVCGVILLACIIHEDSASRANSAKQVALSPEKRGPPRAEGDRVRCDALSALASDRQSVILRLTVKSLETLQIKTQEPNSPVDS